MADNPAGWSAHLDASCNYIANTADANWPTYVGEFSLAVTECQKYLNGGFHTPYVPPDASESACAYYNSNWDSFPDEYIDFLRSYFIAQIDAFEYGDKVRFVTRRMLIQTEFHNLCRNTEHSHQSLKQT